MGAGCSLRLSGVLLAGLLAARGQQEDGAPASGGAAAPPRETAQQQHLRWLDLARRQVADEAVVRFARERQCAWAPYPAVPMPCYERASTVAFHLHIAKCAGRTMKHDGASLTGLPDCKWDVGKPYGDVPRFNAGVEREMAARPERACYVSYEARWSSLAYFRTPPLVVTLVREPISWAVSAMMHCQLLHHHFRRQYKGPDAYVASIVERGCFDPASPAFGTEACADDCYEIQTFVVGTKLADEYPNSSHATAVTMPHVAYATAHLEATVFGLVEHMAASYCVIRYQAGTLVGDDDALAACRLSEPASQSAASHSGDNTKRYAGDDPNKDRELTLRSLGALQKALDPLTQLYAHARDLFFDRALVVQRAVPGVDLGVPDNRRRRG